MCFVVGMIFGSLMGNFSFQMNVQFTAAPYLEMFFGAKQNPHYMLEM